ncbi:MAG TPA: mechanosensitive ion channel domain-containing protein [Nitrososphaera sp.]|jgi:small-conductance mechanosensitive channel|nr:mechanosensitive ion channel domain-containing protein [Nitrososphaera sp.]
MAIDVVEYIPLLSIVFSSMGISFVFKDFIADLVASLVIKKNKDIKVGNRIKINSGGAITKGDVMEIGMIRTTVMEVGDGERLPSVRTGRLIKVPNYMLISSPVMIYGDTIIDEVVSYVSRPFPDSQQLVDSMKESIVTSGHGLIEVGLYQSKDDKLVVHGVFEVKTSEMADQRSKILKEFLTRSSQFTVQPLPAKVSPEEPTQDDGEVILPLQNIEKQG